MPAQFGFEYILFQAVDHNGNFSHNIDRRMTIHVNSNDERLAREQVVPHLKPYKKTDLGNGRIIEAHKEHIYSVHELGRITWRRIPVYEYGKETR